MQGGPPPGCTPGPGPATRWQPHARRLLSLSPAAAGGTPRAPPRPPSPHKSPPHAGATPKPPAAQIWGAPMYVWGVWGGGPPSNPILSYQSRGVGVPLPPALARPPPSSPHPPNPLCAAGATVTPHPRTPRDPHHDSQPTSPKPAMGGVSLSCSLQDGPNSWRTPKHHEKQNKDPPKMPPQELHTGGTAPR